MPRRAVWIGCALGLLLGGALGAGAAWLVWGRSARDLATRLAALESSSAQIQAERERLHRELTDIVHERREMAATAEHLRAQVEQQLRRLEALSAELAPPGDDAEAPVPPIP
ncbi:MAG TPA: hypothetical protein VKA21_17050 [Candidatus Binatia bacterium]|nr:hypothetical protein [Candidatus Binatia bacterium]